jgi:hypothetical protein
MTTFSRSTLCSTPHKPVLCTICTTPSLLLPYKLLPLVLVCSTSLMGTSSLLPTTLLENLPLVVYLKCIKWCSVANTNSNFSSIITLLGRVLVKELPCRQHKQIRHPICHPNSNFCTTTFMAPNILIAFYYVSYVQLNVY